MLMSAELKTKNPPPGGWRNNFIVPWWASNFHLNLGEGEGLRNGGLKLFTLFFRCEKGQSFSKFVRIPK